MLTRSLQEDWANLLKDEFTQDYFAQLDDFISEEYKTKTIYPPFEKIFNAFNLCPLHKIKVAILGQDPYHGPNQAHGLCFSVNDDIKFPPSLRNIFKEIENDLGTTPPSSGNLSRWAAQGVLLLNATLTVREGEAGSHQNKGWERFTDSIIKHISDHCENVVFLLWGAYAIKKTTIINNEKHCILTSPHPSPLSAHRGFLGNRHFSQTNHYLQEKGLETINW